MITFTDAAISHIQQMMNKNEKALGFRVSLKKTGCSGYAYVPEIVEQVLEKDIHLVAQNNLQVYIDVEASQFLQGVIVDFVKDPLALKQKKLVFINPNEKNRCGCGESFTIE